MNTEKAILWNVDSTDEEVVRESIDWHADLSQGESESVLMPDRRTRVEKRHYATGGKYRSVIKIHVKYNKNDMTWGAGTGWLIRNDLLVTAGHVVLSKQRGRAVSLNAYAGYYGLGSVGRPDVQKRQANRVVVLDAYYRNQSSSHDIAIVKLREPFETVQPFTHCTTPEKRTSSLLGVVGYPADKDCNDPRDCGPFMYEQFVHTSWNLHQSHLNLLSYPISTYGGQSGAPVIFDIEKLQCIGTHIEGFHAQNPQKNSASTIGGQYGNPYNALVGAIEEKPLHVSGGVWKVSLSRKGPPEKENRKDPQHTSKSRAQPVSSLPGPSTRLRREDKYAILQQYDTLLLLDDSASMMDDDPVEGNKWERMKRLTADITTIAVKHNRDGVEVQFFNFCLEPRERKKLLRSAEEVMRLFEDVKPYGESPIADRLDSVLSEYCCELKKNMRIKGLNLIVLTDGEPSPDQDIEKKVVQYARELKSLKAPERKVGIQFVQIGNDRKATAYFKRLDNSLQARYNLDRDMVDTVLWDKGGSEPLHQKILLGGIDRQSDNT